MLLPYPGWNFFADRCCHVQRPLDPVVPRLDVPYDVAALILSRSLSAGFFD
jgi:hypothetical protein